MPFTTQTLAEMAAKRVLGLTHTETGKSPGGEAFPSRITISHQNVFAEAIPLTAGAVANRILDCTNVTTGTATSRLDLTLDGASNDKAYEVTVPASHDLLNYTNPLTGSNYTVGQRVQFIIPKSFGESWRPVMYSAGIEVPPLDSSDWFLDENGGVVSSETNLSLSTGKLACYVYVGDFLDDALILTSKGDILTHNASGYVRVPVGADGHVLTADSAEAGGLKFAASGGGNAFTTILTDAGDSPVADSATDTLQFKSTNGTITITGSSGDDSVDLTGRLATTAVTGVASFASSDFAVSGAGEVTFIGSGGVTDHGALTGLSDDDHTHYHILGGRDDTVAGQPATTRIKGTDNLDTGVGSDGGLTEILGGDTYGTGSGAVGGNVRLRGGSGLGSGSKDGCVTIEGCFKVLTLGAAERLFVDASPATGVLFTATSGHPITFDGDEVKFSTLMHAQSGIAGASGTKLLQLADQPSLSHYLIVNELGSGSNAEIELEVQSDTASNGDLYLTPLGTGAVMVGKLRSNGGSAVSVLDSQFVIQDNADATKQLAFQVSGITTATTRTWTVGNMDQDLTKVRFANSADTLLIAGTSEDHIIGHDANGLTISWSSGGGELQVRDSQVVLGPLTIDTSTGDLTWDFATDVSMEPSSGQLEWKIGATPKLSISQDGIETERVVCDEIKWVGTTLSSSKTSKTPVMPSTYTGTTQKWLIIDIGGAEYGLWALSKA